MCVSLLHRLLFVFWIIYCMCVIVLQVVVYYFVIECVPCLFAGVTFGTLWEGFSGVGVQSEVVDWCVSLLHVCVLIVGY